jgi:hypothetical protein
MTHVDVTYDQLLLAQTFLVQLTASREISDKEPPLPLVALSFSGSCGGHPATWSIVLDDEQAGDLGSVLSGAVLGRGPTLHGSTIR